jgi:NAD(P)-dependent dehydrogenase (short-subunit alcohol dehydrogenase family)
MEHAASELSALGAPAAIAQVVDVADSGAVREFAVGVRRSLGPAYAVVNNAAVLGPVGPAGALDLAHWRDALLVDVFGTVAVIDAFADQFSERGRGRVINLSGGGTGGPGVAPRLSAYTASKAALVSLTETLAKELASAGTTVNAVAPGAHATGFSDAVLDAGPDGAGRALYDQAVAQANAPDPIEPFLALVDFLLDDESQWLTGRLLSARWDRVETLRARRAEIETSSLLTMRRIDDALYKEVARPEGDA